MQSPHSATSSNPPVLSDRRLRRWTSRRGASRRVRKMESSFMFAIGVMLGTELFGLPAMVAFALSTDVPPHWIPWLALGMTTGSALLGGLVLWLYPPTLFRRHWYRPTINVGDMGRPAKYLFEIPSGPR